MRFVARVRSSLNISELSKKSGGKRIEIRQKSIPRCLADLSRDPRSQQNTDELIRLAPSLSIPQAVDFLGVASGFRYELRKLFSKTG